MDAGFRNGFLVVVGRSDPPRNKHGQALWDTRCLKCRTVKPMRTDHIQRLSSCGCSRDDLAGKANTKHGHSHKRWCSPEYKAWQDAKGRCSNPKNKRYHRYGGRGIRMCEEWMNDFTAFFRHVGKRPFTKRAGYKRYWSLDRKNSDGHYEPGNVRWSGPLIQARNKGSLVVMHSS